MYRLTAVGHVQSTHVIYKSLLSNSRTLLSKVVSVIPYRRISAFRVSPDVIALAIRYCLPWGFFRSLPHSGAWQPASMILESQCESMSKTHLDIQQAVVWTRVLRRQWAAVTQTGGEYTNRSAVMQSHC